jgi:hypothetical protein
VTLQFAQHDGDPKMLWQRSDLLVEDTEGVGV